VYKDICVYRHDHTTEVIKCLPCLVFFALFLCCRADCNTSEKNLLRLH